MNKMKRGIDAMTNHRADAGVLKLKNDDGTIDEVKMNALETRHLPEFWCVFEGFATLDPEVLSGEGDMEFKSFFKAIDKERVAIIKDLIIFAISDTYPDANEKVIDAFVMKNFFELMMLLIQINLPAASATKVPAPGANVKRG